MKKSPEEVLSSVITAVYSSFESISVSYNSHNRSQHDDHRAHFETRAPFCDHDAVSPLLIRALKEGAKGTFLI